MTSNCDVTAGDVTRSRDHQHDDDVAAKRRRQVKLIIIGITLLLVVVCVILVAVTLSMSEHIDDMGQLYTAVYSGGGSERNLRPNWLGGGAIPSDLADIGGM